MISNAVCRVLSACAVAVLVAAPGLAAPFTQDQDAAKVEKAKEEKAAKEREKILKHAALERELPIAREKVAKAQKDLADQAMDAEATATRLQKELALARMKLETFEKREMPAKISKGQLDLQGAKDGLDNAKEELEQLELMYKEQDLADKTREIVIKRARRDLERAQQRLALQESEQAILVERTLPHEREKLVLEVEVKDREIARATRDAQRGALEKRIAVMAAESEVAKIDAEMASLKGDPK